MSDSTEDQQRGVCGLINLGNTCYLNSSIQILRSIPEWAAFCADDILIEKCKNKESKEVQILKSYADLTRGMWSQTVPRICRPALFLKDIRQAVRDTIYEQFASPIPNDGHEFMQYLLDQFHEALKTDGLMQADADSVAKKAWATIWEKEYSPLAPIFFGADRVQCICSHCGYISTRYETFNMLKVPISETGESFCDMLTKEREPTEIDDYACDKCAPIRRKALIVRKFIRLPRCIMFVFRRFNDDRTKIHKPVVGCDNMSFRDFFAEESDDESKSWNYTPIATLDHLGNHMGGHYNAQTYNCVMKKWYMYDDTHAVEIAEPKFGSTTYIVVLRRQETSNNS